MAKLYELTQCYKNLLDLIDNPEIPVDIISISNWEKHQNVEGMDKVREQDRLRKQKQRAKEKQASLPEGCTEKDTSRDSNVTVTQQNKRERIRKKREIKIYIYIYRNIKRKKIYLTLKQ